MPQEKSCGGHKVTKCVTGNEAESAVKQQANKQTNKPPVV